MLSRIKMRKYGKCHVWHHKNMTKKEWWEEKWERKPLKRDGCRRIFMTSHMTLSIHPKNDSTARTYSHTNYNYRKALLFNKVDIWNMAQTELIRNTNKYHNLSYLSFFTNNLKYSYLEKLFLYIGASLMGQIHPTKKYPSKH